VIVSMIVRMRRMIVRMRRMIVLTVAVFVLVRGHAQPIAEMTSVTLSPCRASAARRSERRIKVRSGTSSRSVALIR
jgi:hypothetical protein